MPKDIDTIQEYIVEYRQQLGAKLKEARKSSNLTLNDIAKEINVTEGTISRIEAGKFPSAIDLYIKIAIVLNLKISLK